VASRDHILGALRRNAPPAVAAPELAGLGVTFADPVAQLARSVVSVGGACARVADLAAADAAVAALPQAAAAARVASLVPGVGRPTLDLAGIADPHALADLDLAILPGELAVAENAAVWVDGRALPHRAVFVITNHLVLVVHARDVEVVGYGLFISGPSKTADIEQVLVIGAQGARTCTVVVIDHHGDYPAR
jgi:L-lactate dehydrogenase complex protein LldG